MKGTKTIGKTMRTVVIRRDAASIIAEKWGVSTRYVRMIRDGERVHEQILTDYLELIEQDNKLIDAVKKSVPFN